MFPQSRTMSKNSQFYHLLLLPLWRPQRDHHHANRQFQARSLYFHLNQSHRSLSAREKHSRSSTPSPPPFLSVDTSLANLLGSDRQTLCSGSHPSIENSSLCDRSYVLTILFLGRRSCDKLVVLREPSWRVSLPEIDSSFPFHPGNFAPILSIKGCTSILRSFRIWSGRPRYFLGNLQIFSGKFWRSCAMELLSTWMGKTSVLEMLILSLSNLWRSSVMCIDDPVPKLMGLQRWSHHRRRGSIGGLPPSIGLA